MIDAAVSHVAPTATPGLFARHASRGRWVFAPHLVLLDDALRRIEAGTLKRLMIWMPPRHGKSEMASKYFPAHFLGTFPDKRVILTSYEASFAESWGRKARDLLEEHGHEFGVAVSQGSSAAKQWAIEGRDGGMMTAGVGGPITGKGAHLLIVDDPIKNAEEAASETIRAKHWDWWRSTAYTRIEPGGAAVVIQTRWNEADLSGRLIQEMLDGGEEWEIICLPAVAERNDQLGRPEGAPLWPERYNLQDLKQIERTVGSYYWSALYQQRPTPEEGGIFKIADFEYAHAAPWNPTNTWRSVRYWDKAASTEKGSDYSAGVLMLEQGGIFYVADVKRGQWTARQRDLIIRTCAKQDREIWGPQNQVWIEQEPAASGKEVAQNTVRSMAGYTVLIDKPISDKVTRARPVAAQVEAHNIYLLPGAWQRVFLEELRTFPNGANDDQVDAFGGAFMKLATGVTYQDQTPNLGRMEVAAPTSHGVMVQSSKRVAKDAGPGARYGLQFKR